MSDWVITRLKTQFPKTAIERLEQTTFDVMFYEFFLRTIEKIFCANVVHHPYQSNISVNIYSPKYLLVAEESFVLFDTQWMKIRRHNLHDLEQVVFVIAFLKRAQLVDLYDFKCVFI